MSLKWAILFISLLLSNIYANTAKISLASIDKEVLCKYEVNASSYYCNLDGSKIIIKSYGSFFSAVEVKASGEVKTHLVEKIENNGNVYYEADHSFPGIGSYGGLNPNSSEKTNVTAIEELSSLESIDNIVENVAFDMIGRPIKIPVSQEYENFLEEIKKSSSKRKEKILNSFYENNYDVKLSDGSLLQCKRKKDNRKKADVIQIERSMNRMIKCGLFSCGKDKSGNERLLISNYNYSMGAVEILTVGKEGILNTPFIKSIQSQKSKENLYFVSDEQLKLYENPGEMSYYGGVKPEIGLDEMIPEEFKGQDQYLRKMMYPNYESVMDDSLRACHDKDIEDYKKAKERVFEKLANAKVVQYISGSNSILNGQFINPTKVPSGACFKNGVYYNPKFIDDAKELESLGKPKTISKEKAKELFDMAKEMNDIAWKFKQDGCYARAHLMARRFEEKGIYVDKAWVKGDLIANGKDGSKVNWNFHVAPVVYVEDENGKVEKMVIDPSIHDKPVTAIHWAENLSERSKGGVVQTKFPFPSNSAFFSKTSLAITNSDPYLPYDKIGMSESDKMKMAEDTMIRYKGYSP